MCWFFFFKQKTAYEMRISDWSSDVCSSDLLPLSDSQLVAFAEQRGGGLFRVMSALAGGGPPWLAQAGMGWALWDLSGHVSDQDTAPRALHLAAEFLADVPKRDRRTAFASLRIQIGRAHV